MSVVGCASKSRAMLSSKPKATSYTLFSPGDDPEVIENYLLLSIDGIGFLVIKHTLDLREL